MLCILRGSGLGIRVVPFLNAAFGVVRRVNRDLVMIPGFGPARIPAFGPFQPLSLRFLTDCLAPISVIRSNMPGLEKQTS